jgi:hypothetical protein
MVDAVPYYIIEMGIVMTDQDEPLAGLSWRVPARVFVRGGTPQQEAIRLPLPGAKYYTLRYLLAALLADGVSLVRNPARSDDTVALVRAVRALGADVSEVQSDGAWALRITGTGGRLRQPPDNTLAGCCWASARSCQRSPSPPTIPTRSGAGPTPICWPLSLSLASLPRLPDQTDCCRLRSVAGHPWAAR